MAPDAGDSEWIEMSGFCIYYQHSGDCDAPNTGHLVGALELLNLFKCIFQIGD